LLDHALKRAVRNISVASLQQQQARQDAAQAAISVLKGMDFQLLHANSHPITPIYPPKKAPDYTQIEERTTSSNKAELN
jgi:hypothetical protein